MLIKDLWATVSMFSFLVSAAVVTHILLFSVKLKRPAILCGVYGGVIALIMMFFSIPYEFSDIKVHYIPLILSFAYFGYIPGFITGGLLLIGELLFSKNIGMDVTLFFLTVSMLTLTLFKFKKRYQRALLFSVEYSVVFLVVHWFYGEGKIFSYIVIFILLLFMHLGVGIWFMEGFTLWYTKMNRFSRLNSQIKSSEQELKDIIRGQPGVIFKFRKEYEEFIHSFCDGQIIRKHGLQPEVFLSSAWQQLLPIEIVETMLPHYEKAWEGHETSYEQRWSNENIYLILLQPVKRDQKVIDVVGSVIDITEKKKMEKALKESEEQHRLIVENTSDLITVLTSGGSIEYVSPSSLTILGYVPEELTAELFLLLVDSDTRSKINEIQDEMVTNNQPGQLEFSCQHKNGSWLLFEAKCMPVSNVLGEVEHIVWISREISERRKAEKSAVTSEKLNIIGELAAGVAHEIRNPLTTLMGFVQMFKDGDINRDYLDLISAELERIELITDDFLVLAKSPDSPFRSASITTILEESIKSSMPELEKKHIQVKRHFPQDLPLIYCLENQLKQAFGNILKNAIEAMPGGGQIEVRVGTEKNELFIEFEDEGHGVPAQLIPMLGEPFYSLKEKGTGLGLMICKKIIQDHDGRISYMSEVEQGTTVRVTLPIGYQLNAKNGV